MRRIIAWLIWMMLCIPATAHAEWWEAETAHFVVKSRASEDEAREYALELAQFDAALRLLQGMSTSDPDESRANKVTVYRVGRPKDIARIAGASGSGIAGFFIPRAGESVGFAPTRASRVNVKRAIQRRRDIDLDPKTVLFHEYTHYFMMQYRPGAYPRWYVEGFAEMMATMRVTESGAYHLGDVPQHRATQIFQLQDFALKRMLDPEYELRGVDAIQHYGTGWLLTHYLSFNTERLRKLNLYLKALGQGDNSVETAERILGDFDALEKELDNYKKGPFPGFDISNPNLALTKVATRRLSAAEEAVINDEMQLARGVDEESARKIAKNLTAAINKYGESMHLLDLLATAHIVAGDYAQAATVGARMTELAPDLSAGWLRRAQAASKMISKDPANADQARQFATKAAIADRQDPRPLILYYRTFLWSGEEPTDAAESAIEQAFPFAGSDRGYRLILARHLLATGNLPTAKSVLQPIAFRGHKVSQPKEESKPTLSRLMALIEEGKTSEAMVMVDEMLAENPEDE